MAERIGRYVINLPSAPKILGSAGVVGKTEGEGPMSAEFDYCYPDDGINSPSWEQAESELHKDAVARAINKSGYTKDDIDVLFAGDLLDQCISTTFAVRDFNVPLVGLFGACSTFSSALGLAALSVDSGSMGLACASASSHFCSAEKQFRFPLEYGGQRTPTAQRTVTGAGACVIGNAPQGVSIEKIMFGRITDLGVTDANNMGAAMAPAAARTIADFLNDTGTAPEDYDMILTGDLGNVGSELLRELMITRENKDISAVHQDCGIMMFDSQNQDVHAGGSGCGCSASIVSTAIMKRLQAGEVNKVLFVGTGALMSPISSMQGESIPSVAHAVLFGGTKGV